MPPHFKIGANTPFICGQCSQGSVKKNGSQNTHKTA